LICDDRDEHKGQGLLLDLGGDEGVVSVLTCHHADAPVSLSEDGEAFAPRGWHAVGSPFEHDDRRSRPGQDVVVLRLVGFPADEPHCENPLLHRLEPDEYDGEIGGDGSSPIPKPRITLAPQ